MKRLMPLLVLVGLLAACDDKPAVPQAAIDAAKKGSETPKGPKIPTTQELLSGPRSRAALVPLPLTMELPPGWGKLSRDNTAGIDPTKVGANILQGYTPNGEVQIQLTPRAAIKQDALDLMLAGGKKEMAQKPQQILKFELRPLGNVKVLERQIVGEPRPYTTFDAHNQPQTTTESVFTWTLSVLVPNEGAYQVYELNFIGLTKSQYDKDKDFLNSIINTLRYAGDTGAAPATAPSAAQP